MKIGLVYGHVASNIGDLCINNGVATLLNDLFPNSKLHVVFRNPNEVYFEDAKKTFEQHNDVNFFNFNTPKDVAANIPLLKRYLNKPEDFLSDTGLSDCDVIFSNSGEFIFSYEDDPRLDLLWRLIPAIASKAKDIRFLTLPSTLGPFEDEEGSNVVKNFLSLNDAYAVRDMQSMKHVTNLVNGDVTVPLLLDPAFFIKHRNMADMNKTTPPRLGVIMRLEEFGLRVGGRRSSEKFRSVKKNNFRNSVSFELTYSIVRQFIDELNGTIDLFVQTRYDYELAKSIQERIIEEGDSELVNLVEPSSIEEYMDCLSKTDFVISSRFHGCILSLLAGVPPMGIYFDSHGHKLAGLYEMLGISPYCFRANKELLDDISDKFISLYNSRDNIIKRSEQSLNKLKIDTLEWVVENAEKSVVKVEYNQHTTPYKNYLEEIRLKDYEDKLNKLVEENYNLKETLVNYKSTNKELLSRINNLDNELRSSQKALIEKIQQYNQVLEENKTISSRLNVYDNIIYTIIRNLASTNELSTNNGTVLKNTIKQRIESLIRPRKNYNKIITYGFKLPEKEKKICFSTNRLDCVVWDVDNIYYTLPKNEVAYLTTKENFNFDLPPSQDIFMLDPRTEYELAGRISFEGLKITLWLIEYDSKKRVKDQKINLSGRDVTINFKTDASHRSLVVALRVSGTGYLRVTARDKWKIKKK